MKKKRYFQIRRRGDFRNWEEMKKAEHPEELTRGEALELANLMISQEATKIVEIRIGEVDGSLQGHYVRGYAKH